MLGFALRAAGASEDTAPPDERAEAWANLQRLRHLLEGSQGGAEAVPADILVRTLDRGRYETTGVHATTSPSMDIQVSSNFERLIFEASGRDGDMVRGLMQQLAQSGSFTQLPPGAGSV